MSTQIVSLLVLLACGEALGDLKAASGMAVFDSSAPVAHPKRKPLARIDGVVSERDPAMFLEMIESANATGWGKIFEAPLQRCAIVGNSPSLHKSGHGAEIDSHDTIIRVGKLPTTSFFEDFGRKTDVLFGDREVARTGMVRLMDGKNVDCKHGGEACVFSSLVLKVPPFGQDALTFGSAPFPVGIVHQDVRFSARYIPLVGLQPSTGFLAFLSFAPLCKNVQLYGFSGLDGAGQTVSHLQHLKREHQLMRELANGVTTAFEKTQWLKAHVASQPLHIEIIN